MKLTLAIALSIACAWAADKKPLPNQAGNDDIELVGTLIMDRQDIQQELGGDLGDGYIVVRVKCTPKNEESLRISPDDFTLISRKDGERSRSHEQPGDGLAGRSCRSTAKGISGSRGATGGLTGLTTLTVRMVSPVGDHPPRWVGR